MALTLIPEYNLAISNWLLRRDDQLGCMVFAPVDLPESQLRRQP